MPRKLLPPPVTGTEVRDRLERLADVTGKHADRIGTRKSHSAREYADTLRTIMSELRQVVALLPADGIEELELVEIDEEGEQGMKRDDRRGRSR